MASRDVQINAIDAMRHVTMNVRVSGVRVLKFRLWIAVRLVSLAALVAGCGLNVTTDEDES